MFAKLALLLLLYPAFKTLLATGENDLQCTDKSFHCPNGDCVPDAWLCDGDNDCTDGSDEAYCRPCTKLEFQCLTREDGNPPRNECIPMNWVCDGHVDCSNQADEQNCHEYQCGEGTFKCVTDDISGNTTHICAPDDWKCDKTKHCKDGFDELNCSCTSDEFTCSDQSCINGNWTCDGEPDCIDGSDEKDCLSNSSDICSFASSFRCVGFDYCIPHAWTCDGENDCVNGSDESNCTNLIQEEHTLNSTVQCNSTHEFMCYSGSQCIRKKWLCDGEYDCRDRSDETNCFIRTCTEDERSCDGGRCKPKELWCDGGQDCVDGSDEFGCGIAVQNLTFCNSSQYRCPEHPVCIDHSSLCMEQGADCPQSVCHQRIEICASGSPNCDCRETQLGGSVCSCQDGFQLEGSQCVDINECLNFGICDHECVNSIGSYECQCAKGYTLVATTKNDTHAPPSKCHVDGDPLLLISGGDSIYQVNERNNSTKAFMEGDIFVDLFDYSKYRDLFVWKDSKTGRIQYCKLRGKPKEPKECLERRVMTDEAKFVSALAMDWMHDNLFWVNQSDGSSSSIKVSYIYSGYTWTVIDGIHEFLALAIDPNDGLLFWSEAYTPSIQLASMDGKHRQDLVVGSHHLAVPSALALDYVNRRIYWADDKLKRISSSDYHGQDIRIHVHSRILVRQPYSLAIFQDRIYWANHANGRVMSANKFTGKQIKKVFHGPRFELHLRVFHKMAQSRSTNWCKYARCHDLCLPVSVFDRKLGQRRAVCKSLPCERCQVMTSENILLGSMILVMFFGTAFGSLLNYLEYRVEKRRNRLYKERAVRYIRQEEIEFLQEENVR